MKSIRIGNTKVLNMFKTYVLACRSYTDEKNTIWIDCHCHCHCQNDQEWSPNRTRMVNSSTFSSRFSTVRLGHNLFPDILTCTRLTCARWTNLQHPDILTCTRLNCARWTNLQHPDILTCTRLTCARWTNLQHPYILTCHHSKCSWSRTSIIDGDIRSEGSFPVNHYISTTALACHYQLNLSYTCTSIQIILSTSNRIPIRGQ